MSGSGDGNVRRVVTNGHCPRCEVCGRAVRVRGVGGLNVWCVGCMGDALPFAGIVGEGDFKGALREYRGGLGSRAVDFVDLRFDPCDREVRAVLKEVDTTLVVPT